MNIYFDRNGQKDCTEVRCNIETDIPITASRLVMKWETGSSMYAKLLEDELQKELWNTVERIRQQAYELGWEDHRKRKKKRTQFSDVMDSKEIAW
jgi:hypothetical protein